MNAAWTWPPPGDPSIGRRIRNLWDMSARLVGGRIHIPRGVRKFRNVDEKNAEDERIVTERIARIRAAKK